MVRRLRGVGYCALTTCTCRSSCGARGGERGEIEVGLEVRTSCEEKEKDQHHRDPTPVEGVEL